MDEAQNVSPNKLLLYNYSLSQADSRYTASVSLNVRS
jgi:hypothetical protein